MTKNAWARATVWFLILVGVGICVLAFSADRLGLGQESGFGWNQASSVAGGALMIFTGALLLFTLKKTSDEGPGVSSIGPAAAVDWPRWYEVLLALGLGLLAITIDIQISLRHGLLAFPPEYDGAYYMLETKSTFYRLLGQTSEPLVLLRDLVGGRFPAYKWAMLANYFVLGEGEWQSYAVRFWPISLLLLLVLWVTRRRAGFQVALVAAVFTVLLPTCSNGLRAASGQFFQFTSNGRTWYLSDLRPDFLFAVLLTCAVVILIENAHAASAASWLVSGIFAALAILTKTSAFAILLLAWGLAVLYVLMANRRRFWSGLRNSVWGFAGFAFLLAPWLAMGGANQTVTYVYDLLTLRRSTYSTPNATLRSEAYYYWGWFPSHMGPAEGWTLLGAGLIALCILLWKGEKAEKGRLFAYLIVSAAVYGLVSATPTKNFFLGLTYYLPLWVLGWVSLSAMSRGVLARYRSLGPVLLASAFLYLVSIGAHAAYALQHWPVEKQLAGSHNRETTLQIAADVRTILRNDEVFLSLPAFGFPNALQYYMVDAAGGYPQAIGIDSTGAPPPEQYAQETVPSCKAVLTYAEDVKEVADSGFAYVYGPRIPYHRAVAQWVSRPGSQYRLTKVYRFSHYQQGLPHTFTVRLYVKEQERPPELVKR